MQEFKKSLIYTILFLLLVTAIATYSIYSRYNKEVSDVRFRVTNTSFLIKEWIEGSFRASDYVLLDMISQIELAELQYPHPDPIKQAQITEFMKSKLDTLPSYFTGVGAADKNCIVTHTYNKPPRPSTIGFDGSTRDWCTAHKKNNQLGQYVSPSFKSNTGNLSIIQNRSFKTATNEFYGMAGLELELSFFQDWLEEVSIAEHGSLAIADTNMMLLARKPASIDQIGQIVDNEIVTAFLSSNNTFKTFSTRSLLDGEHRLYCARKIDDLPFVIVVGEAHQDWLKDWKQTTVTTVIAMVIFWVLSILILRNHWKQLQLRKELDHLAHTDELTGISNRRDFMNKASHELKRVQRGQTHMALLVLDIDRFKLINDTYGHATGDKAIIEFTKACRVSIRDIDIFGRLGGDEFAILLLDTEIEEVRIVVERIRLAIESCNLLSDKGETILMTASIGVELVDSKTSSVNEMMVIADKAVYVSKEKGRNRVEFAN